MSAVIDRIVDGITAVLLLEEEQAQLEVPVDRLPPGSAEGLWLLVLVEDGELIEARVDPEKTRRIKERIRQKRALLLERMTRGRRNN